MRIPIMGNTLWYVRSLFINTGYEPADTDTTNPSLLPNRSNMLHLTSLDMTKKEKSCTTLNERYYNIYSCVMKPGGICHIVLLYYSSLYISL